ncbi:hypothetical protein [Flaviaesturariibacter amylovorans]|uniref:Uncharacterized protein n=1 Tax=Flaviaesturariibacter amylovorans TaxID=1084520 RepID=A0ABP8HE95_9BACT
MPPRLHPVRSTYALLAARCRQQDHSEDWIDWAIDLMEAGYDTAHIVELAGSTPALNAFERSELTARALAEAGIDASDREQVLREYAWHLASDALEGGLSYPSAVRELTQLSRDLGYPAELSQFHWLDDVYGDPVLYGYASAAAVHPQTEEALLHWLHVYESGGMD